MAKVLESKVCGPSGAVGEHAVSVGMNIHYRIQAWIRTQIHKQIRTQIHTQISTQIYLYISHSIVSLITNVPSFKFTFFIPTPCTIKVVHGASMKYAKSKGG